jgi:V/A-type H+-transporting ATPase subunit E
MDETEGTLEALPSSGVEALIERLRAQGVKAGREEAERIEFAARQRADEILAEAQAKAAGIVEDARQEAKRLCTGGEDALRIAMRDTVLKLKAHLVERMSDQVRRLVAKELSREAFLERLILEVAAHAREDAGVDRGERVEILLPRELVGIEELRRNPLELREGSLSHFVLSLSADILAEGVTFTVADAPGPGIRLSLKDRDIQIELTDAQVTQVLLEHLQPRFRAILEGMVK